MNSPLIHIGYHKTGTTWLQNELFTINSNVFIPISKRVSGPSSIANSFFVDKKGYLLSPFNLNEEQIQRELLSIVESNTDYSTKIPVISHERLSGNPHVSGFDSKCIADRLKHIFPNGKILIIIREQISFIISSYFQYLSIGGVQSIDEYINEKYDGRKPGFSLNHIIYNDLISYYISLFGNKNVLVMPYELFNTQPDVFVKKLSTFVGAKIYIKPEKFGIIRNKKPNLHTMYISRKWNLLTSQSSINNNSILYNKFSKNIIDILKSVHTKLISSKYNQKTKDKLYNIVQLQLGDYFKSTNKELSALINLDLSEFGY